MSKDTPTEQTTPPEDMLDRRIETLVRRVEQDEREIGVLSTGEQIAVALVLDRKKLLPSWFDGDWESAVERLGDEWHSSCVRVIDARSARHG